MKIHIDTLHKVTVILDNGTDQSLFPQSLQLLRELKTEGAKPAHKLAFDCDLVLSVVRTRISELNKAFLVTSSGYALDDDGRRTLAINWTITPAGEKALQEVEAAGVHIPQ